MFLVAPLLLLLSFSATGDTLVVPAENAALDAPGAQIPFEGENGRFQNIYNASHFREAMPEGGVITAIAFRINESDRSSFSAVVPDLEVRMSTSPSTAPNIASVFAQNVGVDETVVFARGSLVFSVRPSPTGANPFDLRIPLQRPFFYDPSKGSLAVDLFNYNPAGHGLLIDAGYTGMLALNGPIGSSETVAVTALILQVQFTPVPEPLGFSLVTVGGLLFYIARKCHGD